jgi:aldehyde dehydrogenase (NAD+)
MSMALGSNEVSELRRYQMLIGGEWIDGSECFESADPSTGRSWALVPQASSEDVDRAVAAARHAFESGPWSTMTASQRGLLLYRVAELCDARADDLAAIETRDNGKLYKETRAQAGAMSRWYRFYAGLADKIEGSIPAMDIPTVLSYLVREPRGVVAAIAAWNSPLGLATWKMAPALATGNTVVIKPSEVTSASLLEFATIFEQAGFPPGVVNVITGGQETGAALTAHPGVDHITFTGGTATGRQIAHAAAEHFTTTTLELGGKSANIVFDDADLEPALVGVLAGVFAASGQTCIAGSRLLVQRSIMEDFVAKLIARVKAIRLGPPADADTDMGPVATERQLERIDGYVRNALETGAVAAAGGRRSEDPRLSDGLYYEPTVLTGVAPGDPVAQEEIFGPVLVVLPFDSEDEAIAIANGTPYNLAAGVWSRDIKRAHRVARALRTGTVWVNMYRSASPLMPTGGSGMSGHGRENGIEAVDEFLQTKGVWIELGDVVQDPFTARL